ncbi:MAG TPA: hypothetical protein DEE98_00670 [Elusimicrobia bacterium]|nr:MAG: hypothetical protein A2278_03300 [Elusimicrobia bacterium RIFOXYA12_FULL_49_49]OGS10880.1 MAG: hypothetical protein A2386_06760 [Elusimicrobia bacterium RIFOXYB1_FULL_48_9]OGS15589.1 MAG: hypothetical protein A2251_03550 [Elusimicrobia bacterium RIFOXYA2_FULL_47_53]OGS26855.1 MAG: hypothetical protein A2339_07430 [Elusimicrobia bacterium RIFOXYB12_FULL_50_12]OGS30688.1 MAG: hypothetical protein A2323_07355 [Elusimicrobia bacterium RIFOXYB2_FULL_46_23]HBU68879.1 hypothetical protein [El
MKIAYVSNYLPGFHSHVGGAEKALKQTAELARAKGHEPVFFSLPAGSRANGLYQIKTLESYLPFLSRLIEILKWYIFQFDPVAYFGALKALRMAKPDIVHLGNFQFLTFSVVAAAQKLGIPVIVSIYDYWYFCPLTTLIRYDTKACRLFHGPECVKCTPKTFSAAQSVLLRFRKDLFNKYLNMADRFIVLSESSRSILNAYGIPFNKINVIRFSVQPEAAAARADKAEEDSVLFIGWKQKRKGFHILLEAMKKIVKEKPSAKLTALLQDVKWEKDYEKQIESLLSQLPEGSVVIEKGQKDKAYIDRLFSRAAVVAVPEQWENMSPLIVIEAMLKGKAVVASDLGGIPEFISSGKDGLLAVYDDADDFSKKILYLFGNKDKAAELGDNARAKVERLLSENIIAEELNTEYSKWIKR